MPAADPGMRDTALSAYHRGDVDAPDLLGKALTSRPLDGGLLIADATLRQEAGNPDALDRLHDVVRSAPDWINGHVALAHLRWGAGERGTFLDALASALAIMPRHAGLWMRYMTLLAESGQPLRAADVAARLRCTGADTPALRLIEASHAGAAGAHDRATALLDSVPANNPDCLPIAARHYLRIGDVAAGAALLDQARSENPKDTRLWALTELVWRLVGDCRHDWLVRPDFYRALPIDITAEQLTALAEALHALHDTRWPPLEQSVRKGTQTRGNLGLRREPEIQALFVQLQAAVEDHVARLPPEEADHPLLAHRDAPLAIVSAWSVRIGSTGRHVSHVHPGGILSSAFYVEVPDLLDHESQEGFLELGRPPADITLDIDALAAFRPNKGLLVLFPSYLYHGTRPFGAGRRMSVAFDVGERGLS